MTARRFNVGSDDEVEDNDGSTTELLFLLPLSRLLPLLMMVMMQMKPTMMTIS